MTEEPTTRVDINGTKIEVPTYIDHDTTQAIAAQVAATLKAIEKSSDRIDTQRFALETCMKLATELAKERKKTKSTEDGLALQIAAVNTSVESLLKLLK